MTKLSHLKKTDLVSLASELGVSTDGYKFDIESRIIQFLQTNPAFGTHPKYAQYLVVSPVKKKTTPNGGNSPGGFIVNTPQSFSKHSPEVEDESEDDDKKTTEVIEEKEDEDEEDEDDEENENDDDEDDEEEDDEEDKESFSETISNFIEELKEKISEGFSNTVDHISTTSNYARVKLSNVHLLNIASVLLELGLLIKAVPLYPPPEDWLQTLSPYLIWFIWSVKLPLVISYYINYTIAKPEGVVDTPARRTRSATAAARSKPPPEYSLFDPLVFVLTRTILAHLSYIHPTQLLTSLPVISSLTETIAQSILVLQAAFGEVPYITGFAAIIVVIYAAIL